MSETNTSGFSKQLRLSEELQREAAVQPVQAQLAAESTKHRVVEVMEPRAIYEQLSAGQTVKPTNLPILYSHLVSTDTPEGAAMLLDTIRLLASNRNQRSPEAVFFKPKSMQLLVLALQRIVRHIASLKVEQVEEIHTVLPRIVDQDHIQDWKQVVTNLASIASSGPQGIALSGNCLKAIGSALKKEKINIAQIAKIQVPQFL